MIISVTFCLHLSKTNKMSSEKELFSKAPTAVLCQTEKRMLVKMDMLKEMQQLIGKKSQLIFTATHVRSSQKCFVPENSIMSLSSE